MGIIALLVTVALIWLVVCGIIYVFPTIPEIGKRIMIAIAVLGSVLAFLSAFGWLPAGLPRGN